MISLKSPGPMVYDWANNSNYNVYWKSVPALFIRLQDRHTVDVGMLKPITEVWFVS